MRELEHLARHRPFDAVNARDAVTDRDDRPDLGDVDRDRIVADLVANDLGDLFGANLHLLSSGSTGDELFLEAFDLALHAAVEHETADPRDDAADDRRVHAFANRHLALRGATERASRAPRGDRR